MAAPPTPDQIVVAMQRAVQRVRRMSHAERVQSLKEVGILTTAGKLSASYR
jgi:signal transduction histidine kinase